MSKTSKYRCKECINKYQNARYANSPEAREANSKRIKERYKIFGVVRNEKTRKIGLKWQSDNKHKVNAEVKLRYHVKMGHIVKPLVCEKCGVAERLCGHHEDYNKPLSVQWLCWTCHKREHTKKYK